MIDVRDYDSRLIKLYLGQWPALSSVVKLEDLDVITDFDLPTKASKLGDWEVILFQRPGGTCVAYDPHGGHYITETNSSFPVLELHHKGVEVMTSDVREHDSYRPSVGKCSGKVLMVGLGVGLLPALIWDKLGKEVTRLDIVECDQDVINMVERYIKHPAISIVQGDAWKFPYTCGDRYDFIFLDIWNGNAEAVAVGPSLAEIYKTLLSPNGEVRFWLQEISSRLSSSRESQGKTYEPCLMCSGGWFMGHSGLYGGLCKECTDEYESYLPEKELRSTKELEPSLKSLGYKIVTRPIEDGRIPDLILEGSDGKYLFENKKDLTSTGVLRDLQMEVNHHYDKCRDQYQGLQILIHGSVSGSLLEELSTYASEHWGNWVKIGIRRTPR